MSIIQRYTYTYTQYSSYFLNANIGLLLFGVSRRWCIGRKWSTCSRFQLYWANTPWYNNSVSDNIVHCNVFYSLFWEFNACYANESHCDYLRFPRLRSLRTNVNGRQTTAGWIAGRQTDCSVLYCFLLFTYGNVTFDTHTQTYSSEK